MLESAWIWVYCCMVILREWSLLVPFVSFFCQHFTFYRQSFLGLFWMCPLFLSYTCFSLCHRHNYTPLVPTRNKVKICYSNVYCKSTKDCLTCTAFVIILRCLFIFAIGGELHEDNDLQTTEGGLWQGVSRWDSRKKMVKLSQEHGMEMKGQGDEVHIKLYGRWEKKVKIPKLKRNGWLKQKRNLTPYQRTDSYRRSSQK